MVLNSCVFVRSSRFYVDLLRTQFSRNLFVSHSIFTSKLSDSLPSDKDAQRPSKEIIESNKLNPNYVKQVYHQIQHNQDVNIFDNLTFTANIWTLIQNGVNIDTILENIEILNIKHSDLQRKIACIESMKPRDINDFIPLLGIQTKLLLQIKFINDHDRLPKGFPHRIYYFSHIFQAKPSIVAQRFTKHQFMLNLPFDCLYRKFEILSQYNIKSENLLGDLLVFRCSEEVIRSRLELVKSVNIEKVMPWMIKCPQSRMQMHIAKHIAERKALGKHANIKSLLEERLKMDSNSVEQLLAMYPRLAKCKPSRINSILDYLYANTNYTAEQIATTPSIFYFPLRTVQERIDAFQNGSGLPSSLAKLTQADERTQKLVKKKIL